MDLRRRNMTKSSLPEEIFVVLETRVRCVNYVVAISYPSVGRSADIQTGVPRGHREKHAEADLIKKTQKNKKQKTTMPTFSSFTMRA